MLTMPQQMLHVIGVAEKGKGAREALTGAHIACVTTPEGDKLICEATNGRVAVRAICQVEADDLELNVNLTREAVEAGLAINCEQSEEGIAPTLELESTLAIKPFEGPFPSPGTVTLTSPTTKDSITTHTKDVIFPDLNQFFSEPTEGEFLVGLQVETLKALVATFAKLGIDRVLMAFKMGNPRAPIYVEGRNSLLYPDIEAIGLLMPVKPPDEGWGTDRRWANEVLAATTEQVPSGITVPEGSVHQTDIADEAAQVEAGIRIPEIESPDIVDQAMQASSDPAPEQAPEKADRLRGIARAEQQGVEAWRLNAEIKNPYTKANFAKAFEAGWASAQSAYEKGRRLAQGADGSPGNPYHGADQTGALAAAYELGVLSVVAPAADVPMNPFELGRRAYLAGEKRSANPYETVGSMPHQWTTDEGSDWDAGWCHADDEKMENPNPFPNEATDEHAE